VLSVPSLRSLAALRLPVPDLCRVRAFATRLGRRSRRAVPGMRRVRALRDLATLDRVRPLRLVAVRCAMLRSLLSLRLLRGRSALRFVGPLRAISRLGSLPGLRSMRLLGDLLAVGGMDLPALRPVDGRRSVPALRHLPGLRRIPTLRGVRRRLGLRRLTLRCLPALRPVAVRRPLPALRSPAAVRLLAALLCPLVSWRRAR
jgi:hypothetical protein